jgi:ubiquinone/menaquinone biosynthesis C-methylase UbiE
MTTLSDRDVKQVVGRYTARFEQHGDDPRALNIGDPEKYRRQHSVHAAVGSLDGATLLDVGCGLGYFYEYLRQHHKNVRYIGYDLVEPFIVANRKKFPEGTFRVADISRDAIEDSYDYAILCQVFNNRYKDADNLEILRVAMNKCFSQAKKAVSIDMLSTYVSYRDDNLYYFSPEEIFSIAKNMTPFVSLLHGYLEHHFTIQLFKAPTLV